MKIAGKNIDPTTLGIFGFIVLVVAYYFGSRTGKATATASVVDALNADINSGDLTFELSNYNDFADRAFTALNGVLTDEESLYVLFGKMRTNSDVLQLIKSYGKRAISWEFWAPKTLAEGMASEMNNVEIAKVNDVLSRNNITFQF